MGDLNRKWMGSATTNRHGVATLNFATVSVYDQLMIALPYLPHASLLIEAVDNYFNLT